jgi:SAM-dependent methyltransferase
MRREALFSRSGFYGFLLESNVLLHREATRDVIAALESVLDGYDKSQTVPVLDLACGGWPVAIADVMAAFPDIHFHYTGVDINPDQVAMAASSFPFPENVTATYLIEGNAWDLDELDLGASYFLIFSGMNLHHGTPEEINHLGHQIKKRLQPGGRFASHDVYRPDNAEYLPRPMLIDGEAAALVKPDRLVVQHLETSESKRQTGNHEPDWRRDYLERMRYTLLERGADPDGAESTLRHMRSRDYPISTRELQQIMEGIGFDVQIQRYTNTAEPLGPYVATCIITLPEIS